MAAVKTGRANIHSRPTPVKPFPAGAFSTRPRVGKGPTSRQNSPRLPPSFGYPLSGMISFKKLMGQEDKFYDLLESSAEEARVSTGLLAKILANESAAQASSIHDIIQTRRKDKRITQQITEELCKTFVTP